MTCEERRGIQAIQTKMQAARQSQPEQATGWPITVIHDLDVNETRWYTLFYSKPVARGIARMKINQPEATTAKRVYAQDLLKG